jgi:ABC-2 type transport system ATP-binding protein
MIQVRSLRKSYGKTVAVDGISFEVHEGEIFGLLGPNGAGKTTTISILSGLLRPDAGEVSLDGRDPWSAPQEIRRRMAVVPQEVAVYEELTGRENLVLWGRLYGLAAGELSRAVERALEDVGLLSKADARVNTYSGGMKRRLNLAMALVSSPRILLLDEPTVGIDPQARLNILDLVRRLARDEGMTILYTTHYMDEAQAICQRIAIMDHGRILAMGTLEELVRLAGEGDLVTVRGTFRATDLERVVTGLEGTTLLQGSDGLGLLAVDSSRAKMSEVLEAIYRSDLHLSDLSVKPPTLQDVFIRLTGRELRD